MIENMRFRMVNWAALAVIACLAAAISSASASSGTLGQLPDPGSHAWELGAEVFRYYYEEPGLMDFDGIMGGLHVRFTNYPGGGQGAPKAVRASGRVAYGRTDYDGMLQDGTPYTMSDVDAMSAEMRFLLGQTFDVGGGVLTLFTGLGLRYKEDDSTSDPRGYKRESRYLYLPIAGEYVYALRRDRAIILSMEYKHLISGEQRSHLTVSGFGTIVNEQRSGYGLRGAMAYAHPWGRGHVIIEAFLRHWDIDRSEVVTKRFPIGTAQFVEPENNTLETGLALRYRF